MRGAKTAFKKALVKGSIWAAYNHLDDKHLGIRTVEVVQTNAVAFRTEKGLSWLYFDDTDAEYIMHGFGQFQIKDKVSKSLVLTYNLHSRIDKEVIHE